MAVDAGTGDLYVAGSLSGAIRLGDYALSAAGGADGFVARLTARGAVAWAARIGGASGDDTATHLLTDEAGNAYVAGHFTQEASLAPGAPGPLTAVGGAQNVFVVSYSPQGGVRWAQRAGGGTITTVKGFDYAAPGRLLLSVAPLAQTYTYGPATVLTAPARQQTLLVLNLDAPSGALLAGTRQELLDLDGGYPDLFPLCVVVHPSTGGLYLGGTYYGQYRIGGYELGRVVDQGLTTAVGRLGGQAVVTATRPDQGQRLPGLFPVPVRAGQSVTLALNRPGAQTWRLVNSLGQVVRTQSVPAGMNEASIPTAGLAPGRYTLQILSAAGVATRAVVVD